MKQSYKKADAEVILFNNSDIVTTSDCYRQVPGWTDRPDEYNKFPPVYKPEDQKLDPEI